MKKQKRNIVIGVGALLIVSIIALFALGVFQQAGVGSGSTFTPVYCNAYEFTCCNPSNTEVQPTITTSSPFICPDTGLGCKVTYVPPLTGGTQTATIWVGHGNCHSQSFLFISDYSYKCDVEQSYYGSGTVNVNVPKGEYVYPSHGEQLKITVSELDQRLSFTGRAGATVGIPQPVGSCVYNVASGTKLTDATTGGAIASGQSYTVPINSCVLAWQQSDRFICGNLEEQCSADADCGGHTVNGNQECSARTLQTYGCVKKAPPSNLVPYGNGLLDPSTDKNKADSTAPLYNQVLNRCEITSAKQVQCCGDTDCGSNAFCDKSTFTCKAQNKVQCTQNTDCGVSQQCDYATKQIKTPTCSAAGTCSYTTQSVGCCSDVNCAVGEFCNAKNTCETKTVVPVACPYECCQTQNGYLDRPCKAGQFCNKNSCGATPACTTDANCASGEMCKDSACVPVAQECKDKLYGLVPAAVGTKESCDFWCSIGVKSPEKVNVCVLDYTPLIIFLVVLGFIAFLAIYKKSKGGKGGKRPLPDWLVGENGLIRSKGFWIGIIILLAFAVIVGFWAYFFWAIVVAAVLAIIYIIIRIFVFRKIW